MQRYMSFGDKFYTHRPVAHESPLMIVLEYAKHFHLLKTDAIWAGCPQLDISQQAALLVGMIFGITCKLLSRLPPGTISKRYDVG